jgi:hypothetical protein
MMTAVRVGRARNEQRVQPIVWWRARASPQCERVPESERLVPNTTMPEYGERSCAEGADRPIVSAPAQASSTDVRSFIISSWGSTGAHEPFSRAAGCYFRKEARRLHARRIERRHGYASGEGSRPLRSEGSDPSHSFRPGEHQFVPPSRRAARPAWRRFGGRLVLAFAGTSAVMLAMALLASYIPALPRLPCRPGRGTAGRIAAVVMNALFERQCW